MKKYGVMAVAAVLCILLAWNFIAGGSGKDNAGRDTPKNAEQSDHTMQTEQESMKGHENKTAEKEGGYWEKVKTNFVEKQFGYLENKEEIPLKEWEDEITNFYWSYELKQPITGKEKQADWVIQRDYGDFICDTEGTIKNGYSYIGIPMTITCNENPNDEVFGLNNIGLWVYDKNAKKVFGDDPVGAITNKKPTAKSFYICKLDAKEKLKTTVVFVVPDKYLEGEYGMLLEMSNTGGMINEIEDACIIKVPLGMGKE